MRGGANPLFDAFALADGLRHTCAEGDRRGAGRPAEAFLHPGGDRIQPPGISLQRIAAQRGGGIGVEQHVIATADGAQLRQRLQHGGGSVALHRQQQTRAHALNRLLDLVRSEYLAPGRLDGMHLRPTAASNFAQQVAETTKDRHQHFIARPYGGEQNRLDAGARGAVDQQRPAVFGAEYAAIERHHLVHVVGHRRIVLADQLGRHGAQHARIGVDRPRPHQQALRRVDLCELGDIHASFLIS